MEELLNKLIEKGWKPFHQEIKNKWGVRGNYPCEGVIKIRKNTIFISYRYESSNERTVKWKKSQHSIRELVSKESGLWQFVCKNGMIKKNSNDDKYNSWQKNMYNSYLKRDRAYAEYRLIESALCDEDKLEKFLLDNIKVEGNEQL